MNDDTINLNINNILYGVVVTTSIGGECGVVVTQQGDKLWHVNVTVNGNDDESYSVFAHALTRAFGIARDCNEWVFVNVDTIDEFNGRAAIDMTGEFYPMVSYSFI